MKEEVVVQQSVLDPVNSLVGFAGTSVRRTQMQKGEING